MNTEKNVPRRAIRMKTDLEQEIYDAIVDEWKRGRNVKGNPLEWYAEQRVYIGFKTFLRRLATSDWTMDELERINRDLNRESISKIIIRRFALSHKAA